jgi:hypothetical protein
MIDDLFQGLAETVFRVLPSDGKSSTTKPSNRQDVLRRLRGQKRAFHLLASADFSADDRLTISHRKHAWSHAIGFDG